MKLTAFFSSPAEAKQQSKSWTQGGKKDEAQTCREGWGIGWKGESRELWEWVLWRIGRRGGVWVWCVRSLGEETFVDYTWMWLKQAAWNRLPKMGHTGMTIDHWPYMDVTAANVSGEALESESTLTRGPWRSGSYKGRSGLMLHYAGDGFSEVWCFFFHHALEIGEVKIHRSWSTSWIQGIL